MLLHKYLYLCISTDTAADTLSFIFRAKGTAKDLGERGEEERGPLPIAVLKRVKMGGGMMDDSGN